MLLRTLGVVRTSVPLRCGELGVCCGGTKQRTAASFLAIPGTLFQPWLEMVIGAPRANPRRLPRTKRKWIANAPPASDSLKREMRLEMGSVP